MISTVAVGTDGSATAAEAIEQAAEIARRFEARLVLLSAFNDSSYAGTGEDIELQWAENTSARVRSMLERLEEELGQSGIECETRADEGDPAEVLVRLAEECGADLLRDRQQGNEAPLARKRSQHRDPQGRMLGPRDQDDLIPDLFRRSGSSRRRPRTGRIG